MENEELNNIIEAYCFWDFAVVVLSVLWFLAKFAFATIVFICRWAKPYVIEAYTHAKSVILKENCDEKDPDDMVLNK